jgi:hypothetical protein
MSLLLIAVNMHGPTERLRRVRLVGRPPQRRHRQVGDLVQDLEAEQPLGAKDVPPVDVEQAGEPRPHLVGHLRVDIEADWIAEAAAPDRLLDHVDQVAGLELADLDVGVADDAEAIRARQRHIREQVVEMLPDHVLEEHEAVSAPSDLHGAR